MNLSIIVPGIGFFIVGILAGYLVRRMVAFKLVGSAESRTRQMIKEAEREKASRLREAELEAKDILFNAKTQFGKETNQKRGELTRLEKRVLKRESNLDKRIDFLENKEKQFTQRDKSLYSKENMLKEKEKEIEKLIGEERFKLQRIANLTPEQAKRTLLSLLESNLKEERGAIVKRAEDEIKKMADVKAKEIISLAIQRCAAEHTVESTVSVVSLPDEMKGRVIGREGRNIRALEMATGIDLVVDDTPEAVTLSGFDPVKRQVAKVALERLILDGRIHPARIEEVVSKVKTEFQTAIREEGERTVMDMRIAKLHPKLVEMLGRLKYRTSYGQNVLQHSKEVAHLAGVLAGELGFDVKLARRAGLLHDIGKAVDHEVEGTHPQIGAESARKYEESVDISHAIEAHHEDIEARTLLAVLIQAADAISASRPGARRESLEGYVKRLEKLESIAHAFDGVENAYAIQAGREVRVIVKPDKISDNEAVILARDITKKVEEGMEYPGQVKVTVIRETRAVEYAK